MDIEIIAYPTRYKEIIYQAGRNCYGIEMNSKQEIDEGRLKLFIYHLIQNKHESVLEHVNISILISDVPRSLMEQITRHRLASYSIKSTHYVNHKNFDYWELSPVLGNQYIQLMKKIQNLYQFYVDDRKIPHWIAREILPNSCLTNIFMTTNVREYRLILKQRLTNENVPIMIELMKILCRNLYLIMPECFLDIVEEFRLE